MRMEATFEVGFPPYLTPAHTYPTCVQKLTWPMLWEDIYFDLEKKCISSEQGESTCFSKILFEIGLLINFD